MPTLSAEDRYDIDIDNLRELDAALFVCVEDEGSLFSTKFQPKVSTHSYVRSTILTNGDPYGIGHLMNDWDTSFQKTLQESQAPRAVSLFSSSSLDTVIEEWVTKTEALLASSKPDTLVGINCGYFLTANKANYMEFVESASGAKS